MSTTALWIIGVIAFLILIGFIRIKVTITTNKEEEYKPYATTCKNCGLEFDFGDRDIKMYTGNDEIQHQITECPRCHNYINVDP